MRWTSLTIVAMVLVLAVGAHAGVDLDVPFMLGVGESVTVDDRLMVAFNGIDGDSRCPSGVECIWEGDASAGMWARDGARDITSFTLHTAGSLTKSQDVGRYRVTLLAVDPFPVYPQPIDPNNYVITVVVTLGDADIISPTTVSTWGAIKALYGQP
ncbi:MAG: hypothetical protein IH969_02840 [Candidatus Krumholzibacteriota bacterium]|nr:hypothetical protein [Candidatus Krumholzibacteriota bacterium]